MRTACRTDTRAGVPAVRQLTTGRSCNIHGEVMMEDRGERA